MSDDPIIGLFAEVLVLPRGVLNDESTPENTPQWDSLAAMNLVAAIEDKFGVELSTKEIMSMRSIGLVRRVLRSKNVVGV